MANETNSNAPAASEAADARHQHQDGFSRPRASDQRWAMISRRIRCLMDLLVVLVSDHHQPSSSIALASFGSAVLIRARHGEWAIGRGDRGIRYRAAVQ